MVFAVEYRTSTLATSDNICKWIATGGDRAGDGPWHDAMLRRVILRDAPLMLSHGCTYMPTWFAQSWHRDRVAWDALWRVRSARGARGNEQPMMHPHTRGELIVQGPRSGRIGSPPSVVDNQFHRSFDINANRDHRSVRIPDTRRAQGGRRHGPNYGADGRFVSKGDGAEHVDSLRYLSDAVSGVRYTVLPDELEALSDARSTGSASQRVRCSHSAVRNVEDFEESELSRKLGERQELDKLRCRRTNEYVRVERWGVEGPRVFVPDRMRAGAYGLEWCDPRVLGGTAPLSVPWRLVPAPHVVKTVVTPVPVTRHMLQSAWERIDPDIRVLPDWVWDVFVLPQFGVWKDGETLGWIGSEKCRHMKWPKLLPIRHKTRIVRHLAPFYELGNSQKTWAFFGCPIIPPFTYAGRGIFIKKWGHNRVVWPCLGYTADAWPEHTYEANLDELHHRIPEDEEKMMRQLGRAKDTLIAIERMRDEGK